MRIPRAHLPISGSIGGKWVEVGRYISFRRPGGVRTLSWPCFWLDARTAFEQALPPDETTKPDPLTERILLAELYYGPGVERRFVSLVPWEVFLKEIDQPMLVKNKDGTASEIPGPRRVTVRFYGDHWLGELEWNRGLIDNPKYHAKMQVAYRQWLGNRPPVLGEIHRLIINTGTFAAKQPKSVNRILAYLGKEARPNRPPARD
jgi:hypothetical protein